MCKLHNTPRYHMAAAISLDRHKFRRAKRKPCNSHQTYFSFPSPAPLHNAHAHAEKYGWLARLTMYMYTCICMYCMYVYIHVHVCICIFCVWVFIICTYVHVLMRDEESSKVKQTTRQSNTAHTCTCTYKTCVLWVGGFGRVCVHAVMYVHA